LKNVSEEFEFSDAILKVSTNDKNALLGLDFDAHENYIYYLFTHSFTDYNHVMKSVINRIHTNGTGKRLHSFSHWPL